MGRLILFSFPLTDVYPVRDRSHAAALEPPVRLGGAVQWTDVTAVQAQLHNQQQVKKSHNPLDVHPSAYVSVCGRGARPLISDQR